MSIQRIHRVGNHLTVVLKGETISISNCTDQLFDQVMNNQDDAEAVKHLLMPTYFEKVAAIEEKREIIDSINSSKYLSLEGNNVYIKSVSELTVPEDFALALRAAENAGDDDLVQSYINFWTLVSLNPDSRARTNLFWFLNKYGMQISSSGLFVAYRNVVLKKEGSEISSKFAKAITKAYTKLKFKKRRNPSDYVMVQTNGKYEYVESNKLITPHLGNLQDLYEELGKETAPVYTDAYSKTFTIKVGTPVVMDRDKCDPVQENTCSTGLHVAGKDWLQANYFGNISLKVLVNPADVVAVPPKDSYGKMRVCAYYPIEILDRDEDGNILNESSFDGFEDDFINIITYDGPVNNEDEGNYSLNIPHIVEIDRTTIQERLEDIKYRHGVKEENYYEEEEDPYDDWYR